MFDTQGNSTTLNKRVFSGSSFGSAQTIPATVSAAAIAANQLTGEGAINLTAARIFPAQPTKCITFANVIAATVTGNSDSADFKDTILADTSGVGISNCGEIRVTKDTDPEGGTGTFPYTITRADNSALKFDGSVSVPGTLTFDGDSDLVKDIKVGTNYKLAEYCSTRVGCSSRLRARRTGRRTTWSRAMPTSPSTRARSRTARSRTCRGRS